MVQYRPIRWFRIATPLGLVFVATALAPSDRSRIRLFPEATEIRLAREAGADTIARDADVYVFRGGEFVHAVTGTNGFACMVGRDTRFPSVFPMCFDPEGARTLMRREMMKVELMAAGVPLDSVIPRVSAATRDGRLQYPVQPTITYMMSPHQVLYDGERNIGAAHPHIMIFLPHASLDQFPRVLDSMGLDTIDSAGVLLIVNVPKWSDDRAAQ